MAPSRGDAETGVRRRARVCRAVKALTGVGAMVSLVLLASPIPTAGEAAFCVCAASGQWLGQGRRQGGEGRAVVMGGKQQQPQGQGSGRGRHDQQRPPMAVALAGLVGGGAVAFPALGGRLGLGPSGVMDEQLLTSRRYTDPTYGRHVNTPQSVPRPKCIPGARRVRGKGELAPLPASVEAVLHAATLLVDDDRHTLICARPSTATTLLHKLCGCVLPHAKHETSRALLLGDHRFTTLVKALTRALPALPPLPLTSFLSALARLGHQPGDGFMGLVQSRVRELVEGGGVSGPQAVSLAHALARLPKTTAYLYGYGGVRRGRDRALRQAQHDEQDRAATVLALLQHFSSTQPNTQQEEEQGGEGETVAHAMRALALLPSPLLSSSPKPLLVNALLTATIEAAEGEDVNAQDVVGLMQGLVAVAPMAAAAGPKHEALVRTAAMTLTARAFPMYKDKGKGRGRDKSSGSKRVVLWRVSDTTAFLSGLVSLLPYVPPPPPMQLHLMSGHAAHVAKRTPDNKHAHANMQWCLRRLCEASEVCMQAMATLSKASRCKEGEGEGEAAISAVLQVPTRFDHLSLALAAKRLAGLYGEGGARGEGPRPALLEALVYEAMVMAHVRGVGGFDGRSAATTAQALRHLGIGGQGHKKGTATATQHEASQPQGKASSPSPSPSPPV